MPFKKYTWTSHEKICKVLNNHPKIIQDFCGVVHVNECCTSQTCPLCGSLMKKQIVYGKEYSHVTRCTSPKYVNCNMRGICRERDEGACENIKMCGEYELRCLMTHDNWRNMSEVERYRIRKEARSKFLPFCTGRHMSKAEEVRYHEFSDEK